MSIPLPVAIPASILFGMGVRLRNFLFDAGLKKSGKAPVPVISVGNISAGGTGKTQLVMELIEWLLEDGYKPASLSRGYGRKSSGAIMLNVAPDSEQFGDEAVLVKSRFPEIKVCVAERRMEGVNKIMDAGGCDVIILDDGFQHRAIARDLDIVLLDLTMPVEHYHLLPWGRLREPLSSLKRAGAIVNTRTGNPKGINGIQSEFHFDTQISAFHPLNGGSPIHAGQFPDRRLMLFSGLGNPGHFESTLVRQGFSISEHVRFPDHHPFTNQEIAGILNKFGLLRNDGSIALVTSEKDYFRIRGTAAEAKLKAAGAFYTRSGLSWVSGEREFRQLVRKTLS